MRVVARCQDVDLIEKIRKVGADAIVSPDFTGGLRMASAMIRRQVVSFLDEMLRCERGLRVEEIEVAARHAGRRLDEMRTRDRTHVVIALRSSGRWQFNPGDELRVGRRRNDHRNGDAGRAQSARGAVRVASLLGTSTPSCNRRIRCARAASAGSCVTIT